MIDLDDIDDIQASQIDRRIGQAFAFARVAVADPDIMDVFEDGSNLDIRNIVPNPHVQEHAFIVERTSASGEPITIAVGVCECNATRDLAKGKFWMRAGEQWQCSQCRRVYAFDGVRISIADGVDALIGS